MASASQDRCPICLNTLDNAALTMPCLHRFCFSCIQQWADIKPECPLSKGFVLVREETEKGFF
uniref:RING-type E3 ubiquitin transferase n=1 Tax=Athene cunicularia TaxID=194338 RepID=A0A663MUF8_ATHCN